MTIASFHCFSPCRSSHQASECAPITTVACLHISGRLWASLFCYLFGKIVAYPPIWNYSLPPWWFPEHFVFDSCVMVSFIHIFISHWA